MSTIVVLGAFIGVGVLLIARSVRRRPAPLAVVLRRFDGPFVPATSVAPIGVSGWGSSATRGIGRVASSLSPRVQVDLRTVDRPAERHALDKLTLAIALGALPPIAGWLLAAMGTGFPAVVCLLLAMLGVVGGFVLPDLLLRTHAEHRRRQFRFALSSYLDLVNVLLAGGAGVETALQATAEAGDGWAFAELRNALTRARTTRRSPWAALAELGEQLAVEELVELAASIQLAGVEGARIRASLAAKAAALRGRQLAQIEADAHAASERMGVPTVAMFAAFLALLAYPAVQQIAGS